VKEGRKVIPVQAKPEELFVDGTEPVQLLRGAHVEHDVLTGDGAIGRNTPVRNVQSVGKQNKAAGCPSP
jgi:hypothetical protein